jgi:hypothetical protein
MIVEHAIVEARGDSDQALRARLRENALQSFWRCIAASVKIEGCQESNGVPTILEQIAGTGSFIRTTARITARKTTHFSQASR